MDNSITYLTKEGFETLKSDLDALKSKRPDMAIAIAEAREKGDLSENAEYDAAKNAQGMLEMKINQIETSLLNVRLIDESQVDTSRVSLSTEVKIKNSKTGKEFSYKIVSSSEANIREKKISSDSPIGMGLMGKKPGEQALVETPSGIIAFEVLEISI